MLTKTAAVLITTLAAFALSGIGTANADPISDTAGQGWNSVHSVVIVAVCNSPVGTATNLIC